MSDVELKPCPFCGGTKLGTGGDDEYRQYWVECERCEVVVESEHNVADAIARWNRRTPADRDALADALIAWAADEKRWLQSTCHACGGPGAWNINKGFYGHKHAPDCLHIRARAMRG